jgi:hypothetical protein
MSAQPFLLQLPDAHQALVQRRYGLPARRAKLTARVAGDHQCLRPLLQDQFGWVNRELIEESREREGV